MKKRILLLLGSMMILFAGCGEKKKLSYVGKHQQEEESNVDTEEIDSDAQDMEAVTEDDKEDAAKLGTEFRDLYLDGSLFYTPESVNLASKFMGRLIQPHGQCYIALEP